MIFEKAIHELQKEMQHSYPDIPVKYTYEDLWKYRRFSLNTKRLKKKFQKNPKRYIGRYVRRYLTTLAVAAVASEVLTDVMKRQSIASVIFGMIDEFTDNPNYSEVKNVT